MVLSDKSTDSMTQTQITPGAIRAKSFASGLIASGKSDTAMIKKSSGFNT